jgi:hypothetical protein
MANKEYRPAIELLKPLATEDVAAIRKGDELSGGQYLRMPTIAELVQKAGKRSVVAGTKPVALLLDRAARDGSDAASASVDLYQGKILPSAAGDSLKQASGKFPHVADATKAANVDQDRWTTRVLIDRLWAGKVPEFTMLWLSEPDYAQHGSGPGSPVARAALRSSDDNLAAVLKALDDLGMRDKTDVLVVSDHGFSTLSRTFDIVKLLRDAGFDASKEFASAPTRGQILAVPLGGSACLYVADHDDEVCARLVEFLQRSDFAGAIFTRKPAVGTLTMDQVGIDTPDAPDIVVSMRWNEDRNAAGAPGTIIATAPKYGPGQGHHASLSRFDVHNTFIAAGPDFRIGFVDDLPSGNIDVAPTVLRILGLASPIAMDGRVLAEALAENDQPLLKAETSNLEATRSLDGKTWHQYLRITKLGAAVYYDEANGQLKP